MQENNQVKTLDQLIEEILQQLIEQGYSPGSMGQYTRYYKRLRRKAAAMGKIYYDEELAAAFVNDSTYRYHPEKGVCLTRLAIHSRCIFLIDSYLVNGYIDASKPNQRSENPIHCAEFNEAATAFYASLVTDGLKANTRYGYSAIVKWFLVYLEGLGYHHLSDVKYGDITHFVSCPDLTHLAVTSLGAHLPGLKRFVLERPELSSYSVEIPEHVKKKECIIETYTEDEYQKIYAYLISGNVPTRNCAIVLLALTTGLRAVDICGLKLKDIDWKHDVIRIVQEKTGAPLTFPLSIDLGNALSTYILNDRPKVHSPYIFLKAEAPYQALGEHSGIRNIIKNVVLAAGVDIGERITGSRMTRHTYASRMLSNQVALPVISQALGHRDPSTTMRYLTTDEAVMSSCSLPLPLPGGDDR